MNGIRNEKDESENIAEQERFFEEIQKEYFDIALHFQEREYLQIHLSNG